MNAERITQAVDFDRLNELAQSHIPDDWRLCGDVVVRCEITRIGKGWTVEVRCRSEGGQNRHIWFRHRTKRDTIDMAQRILRGPWQGWRTHE